MAKLNLIETIQTKLSTLTKKDGQLIVTRDNASLYVDLDGARIYISDWIDVSTDEERLAMLTPLSNKYYYVVETNKIWRYISGSWVLVTKDNFVDSSRKIAGIDLNDDITADELISALGIDKKVDKVDGMGLSSNDYSDEEKETVATNKADIAELKSLQDITNTTDTTLYGSYDGIVSINEILGNTEQNTTTGKNRLNNTATTQTKNGGTFTVNADKSVTVNGTFTANTSFRIDTSYNFEKGETYILSGSSGGGISTYMLFANQQDSNNQDIGDRVSNYNGAKSFTILEDCHQIYVGLWFASGFTANNLKFYPMIRPASITDGTYEPYTAGASPNPEYPQEIRSVGEEINLFNYAGLIQGAISSETGQELADPNTKRTDYTSCEAGTSYTISNINGSLRALYFDKNKAMLSSFLFTPPVNTFTTPVSCSYFVVQSANANWNEKVMLNKGTTALPYKPYGTGIIIKTCGKNLLKNGVTSSTGNGISLVQNNDGSITLNGMSTARATFAIFKKVLKAGSYVLSQGYISNGNSASIHAMYVSEGTTKYVDLFNDEDGWKSFTLSEDKEITVRVDVRAGMTINNVKLYPMLEIGTVKTEYEPYTESVATLSEPITLNGIGGVQDYIDAKRGVLVQKFEEVVLNGSGNWSLLTGDGWYQFYKMIPSATSSENAMCTNFQQIAIADRGTKKGLVKYTDNTFRFALLPEDGITTVDEWKTWVTSNPMTVVYELAEPIETPLPEADVEALKSLKTYDGVTHIFTDSEVAPYLDMDYGTSKVGAVALQACAEGCIALNRTSDYVEMTDSDIEAIYNEVF